MAPVFSTPQKRKAGALAWAQPAVTDWVTVQLDKRRESNRLLATAPAIVSSVNLEQGTVNLLYPNVLSAFFYRQSKDRRLLFAIQTFPLAKVRAWEGPRNELEDILRHALLHFAEQRGTAIRNAEVLRVTAEAAPTVVDELRAQVLWSPARAAADLQKGLADHVAEQRAEVPKAGGRSSNAAENAQSTPVKSRPSNVNVAGDVANTDDHDEDAKRHATAADQSTKSVHEAATPPTGIGGNLRDFTAQLAKLLGATASLPKTAIKDALAADFPQWDTYLMQLDEMNKIVIAEDAVFRL